MKKKLLILALSAGCTASIVAQQKTAIGLRLGYELEISISTIF